MPDLDQKMSRAKNRNTFKIRSKASGVDRKRQNSTNITNFKPLKKNRRNRAVAYVDPSDNQAELKRKASQSHIKETYKKKYPYWF